MQQYSHMACLRCRVAVLLCVKCGVALLLLCHHFVAGGAHAHHIYAWLQVLLECAV